MQIAIFGTGNVGGNLGKVLAAKGHQILYGVRDPQSPKTQVVLAAIGEAATAVSLTEAAQTADVIFLTVPWLAVAEVLQNAGDLTGKTLVDCTNRVGGGATPGQSSVEEVARLAPGANVVKTFNTVAAETLLQPHFGKLKAAQFYCGDDAEAKTTIKQLGEEIGYEMFDVGNLSKGYLLDALFQTWIALAMGEKLGRRLALKVLTAHDDQ
jgi:8-hydroxy-5-deazaflavin:NADPH oxidoreductase